MEKSVIEFFKKAYRETPALTAWINTHQILNDDEMDRLKDALVELGCRALVIATQVPSLAPNETHGILPQRFVKLTNTEEIEDSENTFVFAIFKTAMYDLSRYDRLMSTLPECHYTTVFPFEFQY